MEMESAQPKQQEESNDKEEGNKQVQMGENGTEIATNDPSQSAVKEFISTQEEEEEHQQLKIHEQSQEESKEEEDKQVQMKNHDSAKIAPNDDHSQPEVKELVAAQDQEEEQQQQQQNIHEQSQEEEPKEEEEEEKGEIKKVGDGHGSNNNLDDINIQREKKTLEGRTFSREVRTHQYLDRLIRDSDTDLERGLMKAVGDFFDKFQRFPDDDFPTLKSFVTSWLGLVDVPATDLTNLMALIGRMKPIIKAANRKKSSKKQNMGSTSTEMIKLKEEDDDGDDKWEDEE